LAYETETTGLEQAGFDGQTARLLALLDRLSEFPYLAELAIQTRLTLAEAARCYRTVAEFLGLAHIESLLKQVAARDRWERRAQILLRRRFRYNLARLARALIASRLSEPRAYFKQCDGALRLARLQSLQRELNESASPAMLPYFVLSAELAGLAESCLATATAGEAGE
jgi:glutamate dehydrogenase